MRTLKQIQVNESIRLHKLWLDTDKKEGKKATFIGEDLSNLDFKGANLRNANFYSSNLQGANFENATLISADLHSTILNEANFKNANLDGADISGSYISDANFEEANLREVNFWRSDLMGSSLKNANLHGAQLLQTGMKDVDLHGANLYETSLPLGYGGAGIRIDDKQTKQILYHLVMNVSCSEYVSENIKKSLLKPEIVALAMKYHRAQEYERIDNGAVYPI